jgi:N-acetylmuramoyl-L-alanine amidase
LPSEAIARYGQAAHTKSKIAGKLFLTQGDDFMRKLQQGGSFFRRLYTVFNSHRVASMIAGQVVIAAIVIMFALNSIFGVHLFSAFAQIACPSGDTVYTVQSGDTLSSIAAIHGTSFQTIAQHSQIANPNLVYVNQQVCVPGQGTNANVALSQPVNSVPAHNTVNPFAYGQCTWWAAQRYHDLHGFYVPWTTNANAFQWTVRANDFHWHVSDQPSLGAIIDFQPGVQYASTTAGHVAVVEQILGNGDVVTSNMNVSGHPFGSVVNLTFHTGAGVTFITA